MGRLMDAEAEAMRKDMSPQLVELAEAIGKKANATAVFGSPVVDGDRTVIPVAEARFGLGVGDGLIAKGLGGGMTAKPLGFIVIEQEWRALSAYAAALARAACAWRCHRACARDAIDAAAKGENRGIARGVHAARRMPLAHFPCGPGY